MTSGKQRPLLNIVETITTYTVLQASVPIYGLFCPHWGLKAAKLLGMESIDVWGGLGPREDFLGPLSDLVFS